MLWEFWLVAASDVDCRRTEGTSGLPRNNIIERERVARVYSSSREAGCDRGLFLPAVSLQRLLGRLLKAALPPDWELGVHLYNAATPALSRVHRIQP
jgi:hypothetical protein